MISKSYRDLLADKLGEEIAKKLPRSFDIIGEIALIKIPDELMIHSREIGEAIMKIHKNVRSVYARRDVSGVYRISETIHIAGEEKSDTIYTENSIKFYVDIKRMYVNPRLSTERARVTELVSDGDKVLDLFAGYGAYALNIAKRRDVYVVASDLNIYAVEAMKKSIKLNKLIGIVEPIVGEAIHVINALREKTFDVIIADNPTKIDFFIKYISKPLKRDGRLILYVLADDIGSMRRVLAENELLVEDCIIVREYSAKKNIFRCIANLR